MSPEPLRAPALDPRWLVRLRWAAVAAMGASIAGTRFLLGAPFPLPPLVAILAALALANAALTLALRHGYALRPRGIAANLLLDVAALTGLLVWTGGAMNPFTTLYLLHVALAAVLLPRAHSLAVTLAAAAAFGGLLLARPEAIHVWHSAGMFLLHVRGMWLAFALTALCLWYFVERVSSALQHRERELFAARESALRAERMAALGTLAAGAAHELNTPLGTVAIAAAELVETLREGSDERASAEAIRAEVRRCKAILERLRAHGEDPARRTRSPAGAWLAEALDAWRARQAEPVRVELRVAPEAAALPLAHDGDALAQALHVLLDNARRASDELLEVTLAASAAGLAVSVRDRGAGMSDAALARAGEPFFTTRAHGEGTGLGLFYARAVAAQHGGALELRSGPEGTTATLALPLAAPRGAP